jgi:hypothetical protein
MSHLSMEVNTTGTGSQRGGEGEGDMGMDDFGDEDGWGSEQ